MFSLPLRSVNSTKKAQPTRLPPIFLIRSDEALTVPPVASKSSTNKTFAPFSKTQIAFLIYHPRTPNYN